MGRSVKKGPFVDQKLLARIVAMNENMVKSFHNIPGYGWSHHSGL